MDPNLPFLKPNSKPVGYDRISLSERKSFVVLSAIKRK